MTHPLFRQDIFIETAFARRFQAMLRSTWRDRSWHVIVADPGAGKTMGIRDLVKTTGSSVILAVTAPKNNEEEQALGDQLYTALGLPLRGHWHTRKPKLMGHLHQYGTEFLVVDDAHDLSLKHLMFIKELTDQGRLQYDHPLGLCLVAAGRGNTIPLKETLDMPETTWVQFRRRFDKLQPFCRIAGHTSEEVREILASLETVYQELFPQLNLRQWSGFIYTWLTQSTFDPTNSGRVTMDYLMKLVTTALEWSRSGQGTRKSGQRRWSKPPRSSCSAEIRFGLLTEKDQAVKLLHQRLQASPRRVKRNRSLPHKLRLSHGRSRQQNRQISLDLGRRSRSLPPDLPNARFSGWFKFPSSVLRRVVSRLWSVPTVGEHGPFLRAAAFCASSLTTNAKRTLP
jgi:hypothetical protein